MAMHGSEQSPDARAVGFVAARSLGSPLDPTLRVTANFHPDRSSSGIPVLQSMRQHGTYLSQFVTGTSNGGLTAFPGGDRWRWESTMFGGAYDNVDPVRRPIYGALNHRRSLIGGSPRFGSAHFRFTAELLRRTTFCYPDSCFEPGHFAVAGRFELLELLERDEGKGRDPLDAYVEAHVHGAVRFDRDVEALVLDPSYRGTQVEDQARLLQCPLEWHDGFRLRVDVLRQYPDFRGPRYVELGAALAEGGVLTPHILGRAACTGRYEPQSLKRVWHYLAWLGTAQAQ